MRFFSVTLVFLCICGIAKTASGQYQHLYGCFTYAYFYGRPDHKTMPDYWMGFGLASMDINRDGHLDLLCSATGPKTIFVYFGGPALFDTTADLTLHGSADMTIGDFDGDGLQDLAARLRMSKDPDYTIHPDSVLIYPGVTDGPYTIDTIPRYVFAIPVNDSLRGEGSGYMGEHCFQAGDADGDGIDELIMGSMFTGTWDYGHYSGGVCIWHAPIAGDSIGILTYLPTSDAFWSVPRSIETGDVNGDGVADIVLAVLEQEGVGAPLPPRIRVAFGSSGRYPDPSHPDQFFENDVMGFTPDTYVSRLDVFWVTLLDVNRDGIEDLLWVPCTDSLLIMFGGSNGLSGRIDRVITNPNIADWAGFTWNHHRIGDTNGDGYDDYVIGQSQEGMAVEMLFLGNEDGLANEPKAVCVGTSNYSGRNVVNVGDLNGDGTDEYVCSHPTPWEYYLPYDGFAVVIKGQGWMQLGVKDSSAAHMPDAEPFSVEVYPQPGSGDFNISVRSGAAGAYTITIYTLDGKEMYRRRFELVPPAGVFHIRAQDLPVPAVPSTLLIDVAYGETRVWRKYLVGSQ